MVNIETCTYSSKLSIANNISALYTRWFSLHVGFFLEFFFRLSTLVNGFVLSWNFPYSLKTKKETLLNEHNYLKKKFFNSPRPKFALWQRGRKKQKYIYMYIYIGGKYFHVLSICRYTGNKLVGQLTVSKMYYFICIST